LIIAELIRQLLQTYDLPWKTAVEITRTCVGYTNHTILKEALEQWDSNLMYYLLPQQHKIIERLNQEFCDAIRLKFPQDEEKVRRMTIIDDQGTVKMAHLAIYGSHSVNGVAALHSKILKETLFKDFDEMFPGRFTNVTNGVTQRRWLLHCNPDLASFITKLIGDSWITDFMQIERLAPYASIPAIQQEFLAIKRKNKQQLIKKVFKTEKMRDESGAPIIAYPLIDYTSLFDVQIKRFHEYKRQLLNLIHAIMLYQEIVSDPETKRIKRTIILAGKAAAGYETAKDIILLAYCLGRKINKDPRVKGLLKLVFIENYNVSHAELIIPAADLSEQISTAGTEASGTGNMKLAINGALTIGTNDGANIEMKEEVTEKWWPFSFGASTEEIRQLKEEQSYHPESLYNENPQFKNALEALIDGSFTEKESEKQALQRLYQKVTTGDSYFILKDLGSYYETQKQVEVLFSQPLKWAEYALHNISKMGKFSTDYSIKNYAEKIWGLEPIQIDDEILERVRSDYSEHDQCRIY
jgi:starch phosphorylase